MNYWSTKKKESVVVTNDLENCFQWHEGLDPDHIFDEEKEMIQQLREVIPELVNESDKFVAVFLFARRHNMKEVTELLQGFFKKKAEHLETSLGGYRLPSFTYTPCLQTFSVAEGSPMMHPRGYRDNYGRMLRMMTVDRLNNSATATMEQAYAYSFWQVYYMVATEPLNAWRNGILILIDLKNLAWRHVTNPKAKEISNAQRDIFPFRMRSILAVNGNIFISAIVAAVKLFLPKKIVDRSRLLGDITELEDLIPPEYLVPHFGGKSKPYYFQDFADQIFETEKELFDKGIWKVPDGATAY